MVKLLLLVTTLLLLWVNVIEGYYYYFQFHESPDCIKGYRPGGGIPIIKPINAPVATAQAVSVAYLAGKASPAAALSKELINGAKVFANVLVDIAPKLVSGLGVFSAAMGVLGSLTKPTPQDLLNKVNEGMRKLTEEVNERLQKMQGYVDGRVIQAETRRIDNHLQSLNRLWENCVQQSNRQNVITCLRNAVDSMNADAPHFMIFDEYFNGKKSAAELKYYDIHRLEAVLIPFRDFATYHIYTLQMLIEELKDYGRGDSAFYKRKYLNQLAKMGLEYSNYAKWAYELVYKKVVTDNQDYIRVRFNGKTSHKEGWWMGVHTHDKQTMYPTCSKDENSPINDCGITLVIRADGKRVWKPVYVPPDVRTIDKALIYVGQRLALPKCKKIHADLKRDVPNYWQPQLMETAKSWKLAADSANEQL